MNNSQIIPELPVEKKDRKLELAELEAKHVNTIEAIQKICQTQEWSTLKQNVFDELPPRLRKELMLEAKGENPNTNKLNRLTGELKWAERFSDFDKWEKAEWVELNRIRLMLYGKPE